MSRRVVGDPMAVIEPSKELAQALEASVYCGRCMGLLMNQVGSERSQANGPDLSWQWCGPLVDPHEPRLESGEIVQIGLHSSRRQIATYQMPTEGLKLDVNSPMTCSRRFPHRTTRYYRLAWRN